MTETSGGEVLARMLQAEGVEMVFGIIDGTYFGFYSSLRAHGIELITPRHETSAAAHGRRLRAADRASSASAWRATARGWPTCCPAWRSRTPRATACC